jgi:hypothetical protein
VLFFVLKFNQYNTGLYNVHLQKRWCIVHMALNIIAPTIIIIFFENWLTWVLEIYEIFRINYTKKIVDKTWLKVNETH